MATPFTTFPIPATFAVSEWGLAVNCKDFGAVGDNTMDDTAAIQAAIDYAYANNRQTVYIPRGQYKTTSSLWLDPPTNMRLGGANFTSPSQFQFSLCLTGEPGLPNDVGDGTVLRPTFSSAGILYIGPGQGMRVAHLHIQRDDGLYTKQKNSAGIGFALCGANGGSSRTSVEHCLSNGLYTGFMTGANGFGSLCDSNTFFKCSAWNCAIGANIAQSQNFMNSFYDCNLGGTRSLYAPVGTGAHVFGGNFSAGNGVANFFTISSVSAVTATLDSNNYILKFNATVAAPDAFVGQSFDANTVYECYAVKTAHFGVVPLQCTNWNGGTHVAEFTVLSNWGYFHFPYINAVTDTDFSAEIQACTVLYAAEMRTIFTGSGISVHGGVHIENSTSPTRLLLSVEATGYTRPNTLNDITFNVDPTLAGLRNATDPSADKAKFFIQQTFPFIQVDTAIDTTIQNCHFGMTRVSPAVIGLNADCRFVMRDMTMSGPYNVRQTPSSGFGSWPDYQLNTGNLGAGEYDVTPFVSFAANTTRLGDKYRARHWQQSSCWGWRPDPNSRPGITRSQLASLEGPPSISFSGGFWSIDYPLLWGDQIYSVIDYDLRDAVISGFVNSNLEVASDHKFYSYGIDLTTGNVPSLSWSYKGQSQFVYANDRTLELMFPGLGVRLNDGSSNVLYIVTGVFPSFGYFTVARASAGTPWGTSGNKTTVFNGTAIQQDPYVIQRLAIPPKTNYQTPATAFSITLADFDTQLIMNPAGVLATGTITMCANAYDGQIVSIRTIQTVTALTISPNAGQSVAGNPSTITAGQRLEAVYRKTNTTWYFGR